MKEDSLNYISKVRGSWRRPESIMMFTILLKQHWVSCKKRLVSQICALDRDNFFFVQIKLLNSISENFNEAMKSAQSKAEYSKQFENIVRGVEVSVEIVYYLRKTNKQYEGVSKETGVLAAAQAT